MYERFTTTDKAKRLTGLVIFGVLAALFAAHDANKKNTLIIEEMRDPGGFKRQSILNATAARKAADKTTTKIARGSLGTIVWGVSVVGLLLGGAYLKWGGVGLCWAFWLLVGPFVVAPAMIKLSVWYNSAV